MNDPHLDSLLHPLRDVPSPGVGNFVCIGLRDATPALLSLGPDLTFVQGFRPDYLRLAGKGLRVLPGIPAEPFANALIRLGRHRRQNEEWVASALQIVPAGGMLIAAGAKTDGAASLRKRIARIHPDVAHAAMNHGEVFWLKVPQNAKRLAGQLQPAPAPLIENRFHVSHGMFSSGRIDPGSLLLISALPQDLGASVADFGAGWGYLSAMLAEQHPEIRRIDLYEADHESLQASRRNVPQRDGLELGFHWLDLASEPVSTTFDTIVCNPPFHKERQADPSLGAAMLGAAAAALRPKKGRLYLVANRHLPYESVLARHFSTCRELLAMQGYKVLEAIR